MDIETEIMTATLKAPIERKRAALAALQGISPQAEPIPHEPFVTLRHASKQIGCSTTTLWRLEAPGHDIGGRRRFKVSEVAAYLESTLCKARAEQLRAARKTSKTNRG